MNLFAHDENLISKYRQRVRDDDNNSMKLKDMVDLLIVFHRDQFRLKALGILLKKYSLTKQCYPLTSRNGEFSPYIISSAPAGEIRTLLQCFVFDTYRLQVLQLILESDKVIRDSADNVQYAFNHEKEQWYAFQMMLKLRPSMFYDYDNLCRSLLIFTEDVNRSKALYSVCNYANGKLSLMSLRCFTDSFRTTSARKKAIESVVEHNKKFETPHQFVRLPIKISTGPAPSSSLSSCSIAAYAVDSNAASSSAADCNAACSNAACSNAADCGATSSTAADCNAASSSAADCSVASSSAVNVIKQVLRPELELELEQVDEDDMVGVSNDDIPVITPNGVMGTITYYPKILGDSEWYNVSDVKPGTYAKMGSWGIFYHNADGSFSYPTPFGSKPFCQRKIRALRGSIQLDGRGNTDCSDAVISLNG